jgi:hypothetical protein
MFKHKCKSQTATEYLVILSVVIIIALVVVNTMGGFPGIGSNSGKKVSDIKLATDTVGIESYNIGNSTSTFKLKNNYFDTITVTEFKVNQQANLTCNSSNTNPALPVVLNIGESKLITCNVVNSSTYSITTKQTPVVGVLYTDNLGAQRTAGNVQSYNNTNSTGSGGSVVVSCPTGYHSSNGVCSNTYTYSMSSWNRSYSAGETLPGGVFYSYDNYSMGHPIVMDHNGVLYGGYYRGYIYSSDEGDTWTLVDISNLINASTKWTVIETSFDGQRIWLSIPGVGTYVSKNAGVNFTYETQLSSLNYSDGIVRVVHSPFHANHLLAYTAHETGYGQVGGRLYRSIDSGDTWQDLNTAIASAGSVGPTYSDPVAFEPTNTSTFYYVSMPSSCPGSSHTYITNNNGTSFSSITGGTTCYANGIERAANGATGRILIAGACNAVKYTSITSYSWTSTSGANGNCGGGDIVTAHPLNLSKLISSRGMMYSTNGGTSAQSCSVPALNSGDWVGYSQLANPNIDGVFYIVSYYGKILKSSNSGATFTAVGAIPYSQYDT